MISRPLITLLLPVLAQAAVIRGSVVEHTTGKPLSRTTVAVQPIAGTAGNAVSKRTDKLGGFEFQGLAGGAYVVTFSRAGFAQAEYGQKEWNSAGYPIFLEEPAAAFLQVRLRRQGAISGTVLDDEDIGLPDHEVALYRNTRPPEFLTRAKTDDRGVYRFGGLMPGSYLVRTVGKHYDEGDYVPTFHRESSRVEDAQGVDVMLDEQVNNVNIKPRQGQLVTIDGAVSGGGEGSVVNVVLVSDMGRIEQQGRIFRFEHMPPGRYEVYAQIEAESVAGYMDLAGSTRGTLRLAPAPAVNFQFTGGSGKDVQISARRKDLAGTAPPVSFRVGAQSGLVTPGRWEFRAFTPPDLYVASVGTPRLNAPRARPDGWIELMIDRSTGVRYTLSNRPASIHGVVTSAGREPVAGAPVFLEAWDAGERKRMIEELREIRTDRYGRYRFEGVPPGEYRIVSTFEYRTPDPASMEKAGATGIRVDEAQARQLDLDLYVIR